MPVFRIIREETQTYTAFIEADSVHSAELYAHDIPDESWESNQDVTHDYTGYDAVPGEYKPKEVIKI